MTNEINLSEREKEILRLVAEGLTNREIAQRLFISPNTVKVHVSNIFGKTGVVSRTEATVFAIEHRIVDVPGGEGKEITQKKTRRITWITVSVLVLSIIALIIAFSDVFAPSTGNEVVVTQDPADRWAELSSLPELRKDMATVAYGGDIYVIAGSGLDAISGSVFKYVTETDTWVSLTDKPTPVTDVQGALIGEKIYIPGGRKTTGEPTNVLEIYDPRHDTWESGSALPENISAYSLTAFEGQLYLFGGWNGQKALSSVYVYNPVSDTWRKGSPMAASIYNTGIVALADRIILLGGENEQGLQKAAWVYFPSRDIDGETPWESCLSLPVGLTNLSVASVYDAIYAFGANQDEFTSDQFGYVLIDGSWQDLYGAPGIKLEETRLIPMGSVLYVLNILEEESVIEIWEYQAYYFEIYLPIIPK